jgi:hypothetical protein
VVGEIDAAALRLEHAGEERRDVRAHAGLGQRTGPERGDALLDPFVGRIVHVDGRS